jgi:hypothetical protein
MAYLINNILLKFLHEPMKNNSEKIANKLNTFEKCSIFQYNEFLNIMKNIFDDMCTQKYN